MIQNAKKIYQSPLLTSLGVLHGFSSKTFGDIRRMEHQLEFYSALGVQRDGVVWAEQVHSDTIHIVTPIDLGTTIAGVDGLVAKRSEFIHDSIFLTVHTADCVPLLMFDPKSEIVGVAHAGWKGTVQHIGTKLVSHMQQLGAQLSDIRACIGPRIGVCCYDTDETRIQAFLTEFPSNTDIVVQRNDKMYLNLGKIHLYELLFAGLEQQNIEFDETLCTYDMQSEFYSFRRSGKPLDGEQVGIIGFFKKTIS